MAALDDRSDLWVRQLHPAEDDRPRLVGFPHAGGSVSYYHPLSAGLAPRIAVGLVQYPGRQDRRGEQPIDDIGKLADEIVARSGQWLRGAPTLYGHSMGATLAYEVARRLQHDHGTPPAALIVSGQRAPSIDREEGLHLLDDEAIIDHMRRLGGTDTSLLGDPELREMIMPSVRSDYKAIETYRHEPGPKLRCPIVVMTGESDPRVLPEDAQAWREHTEAECSHHRFPGGHFFISAHAAEVMRVIADGVAAHSAR